MQLGERNTVNLWLESERLLLRPLEWDDRDLGVEMFTDPEVMRYVAPPYTPAKVDAEMPDYLRRCAGGCIGIWCTLDKSSGERLGSAALLPLPIEALDTEWELIAGDTLPEREIEIGYLLKRAAWGQGYATEVCRRLIQFAFEESPLQELVAITDPANAASQKVLLKSGLVAEGPRRAYGTVSPGFRITRELWLAQQGRDAQAVAPPSA